MCIQPKFEENFSELKKRYFQDHPTITLVQRNAVRIIVCFSDISYEDILEDIEWKTILSRISHIS